MLELSVMGWSAWAPGLASREAWQAWSQAPSLPEGDKVPALAEVPALQRRRIEPLGRMAIQAAYWCQEQAQDFPLVFASRHGDVQGSLRLLESLVQDEPLSPTGFGLSVHNAIAALYSIIRSQHGNYVAIAGGRFNAAVALVEAAGLLADGAPEVMVVCYEDHLPAIYDSYADAPTAAYAWCWRIARAGTAGAEGQLRLQWQADATAEPAGMATGLPHDLAVLQWWLAGARELDVGGRDGCWRWHRDA